MSNYHPLMLVSSSYSLLPLNNKWDAVLGRWKCTKQRHYVTNSLVPAILLTVNFTCCDRQWLNTVIFRRSLSYQYNRVNQQTKLTGANYSTNISTKDKNNIRNMIFAWIARILLYFTYSIFFLALKVTGLTKRGYSSKQHSNQVVQ